MLDMLDIYNILNKFQMYVILGTWLLTSHRSILTVGLLVGSFSNNHLINLFNGLEMFRSVPIGGAGD